MTNESKDIKFVGISVKDGQAPAIKFKVLDCINDKTIELSIPRTELSPKNVENLIARNNGICEEPEEICNFLLKSYKHRCTRGTNKIK